MSSFIFQMEESDVAGKETLSLDLLENVIKSSVIYLILHRLGRTCGCSLAEIVA